MAKNRREALLATDAFLFSFPASETLEPGVNAALPVGVKDHGIFSEGFELAPSRTVNNVYGSNFGLIRTISTEGSFTMQGTLTQTNDDNMELITGSKRNTKTNSFHWDTTNMGPTKSFVLDMIDEDLGQKVRWYIKEGQVTEISGLQVVNTGLLQYNITITAYASLYQGKMAHVVVSDGDYTPVEETE